VTAFYEIVPAGAGPSGKAVDPLKYQSDPTPTPAAASGELLTVKLRFKPPAGTQSTQTSVAVKDDRKSFDRASDDFRFAAAVASFGMLLRDSEHKGTSTFDAVLGMAAAAKGKDAGGYRAAFVKLVEKARALPNKP
jgi:Ca-activated chloride channel family protein